MNQMNLKLILFSFRRHKNEIFTSGIKLAGATKRCAERTVELLKLDEML